jgi:hypothetical protein
MTKRKHQIALHGTVAGAVAATPQKYIIEIRGELPPTTPAEAKETIFKVVKELAKDIPGAQEFWVSQPRNRKAATHPGGGK